MARRYGQRPSSLLSRQEIFRTDMERLWFDVNVALRGMMAETQQIKRREVAGPIRSRGQAEAVAETARRQVEEMERGG